MLHLLALALLTSAGDYSGSKACAKCHPAQFASHAKTGHAEALRRVGDHRLVNKLPQEHTAYRPPDFRLTWRRDGTESTVTATNGAVKKQPVEWAFGAGVQAITFVSHLDEDRYIEHHLSWYRSTGSLGLTPGHRATRPASLVESFGVIYPTFAPDAAILRCFRCHSTGPLRLTAERDIVPSETGVHCEACHGPGAAHVKSPVKSTIYNPASGGATSMNQYCGNCHRPPASESDDINWSDPWNTRHQPLYLARSKCFIASEGKLSCTTCHPAHVPLERNSATYKSRCISCHEQPHNPESDCVSCHMPAVRPHQSLTFTNHWIGIFGPDKLQPR